MLRKPNAAVPKTLARANRSAAVAGQNISGWFEQRQRSSLLRPKGSATGPDTSSRSSSKSCSAGATVESGAGDSTAIFGALGGEEGSGAVRNISMDELLEIRSFAEPPAVVKRTLQLTCIILNAASIKRPAELPWAQVKTKMANDSFLDEIKNYDMATLRDSPAVVEFLKSTYFGENDPLTFSRVERASRAAAALFRWSAKAVKEATSVEEVPRLWVCESCGEENKLSRQSCNNCGKERKWWVCFVCEETNKISRQYCNGCNAAQVSCTKQIEVADAG